MDHVVEYPTHVADIISELEVVLRYAHTIIHNNNFNYPLGF